MTDVRNYPNQFSEKINNYRGIRDEDTHVYTCVSLYLYTSTESLYMLLFFSHCVDAGLFFTKCSLNEE